MPSEERLSRYGWDRDSLFYPSLDRDGALLAIFLVLFAVHFGELFGTTGQAPILFDIIPLEFGYQIVTGVLSVAFAALLYRAWPEVGA